MHGAPPPALSCASLRALIHISCTHAEHLGRHFATLNARVRVEHLGPSALQCLSICMWSACGAALQSLHARFEHLQPAEHMPRRRVPGHAQKGLRCQGPHFLQRACGRGVLACRCRACSRHASRNGLRNQGLLWEQAPALHCVGHALCKNAPGSRHLMLRGYILLGIACIVLGIASQGAAKWVFARETHSAKKAAGLAGMQCIGCLALG